MAAKIDPLLAAVIAKLPPAGGAFAREQRVNWLRMMAMALGSAYGEVGAIAIDPGAPRAAFVEPNVGVVVDAAPQPEKANAPGRERRFYIDREGFARRAGGAPISPADLHGEVLYDLRGETGDLGAIVWADGVMGTRGLQLEISAAT